MVSTSTAFLIFSLSFALFLPLLLRLALWKASKQKRKKKYDKKVSVVVALRNEEGNVKELVQSLKLQKYEKLEFILVNDRSTDHTVNKLIESIGEDLRFRTLQVTAEEVPVNYSGKKVALTRGIEIATGEIILLTDADCRTTSSDWVSEMVAPFDDKKVEIVLGLSPYLPSKNKLLSLIVEFETAWTALQYGGFAALGLPYMGVGRNLAYRKKLFCKKGGFKKWLHIPGGDDDLFVAAHAKKESTALVTTPTAYTQSASPQTWQAWWKQKTRHLHSGRFYPVRAKLPPALSLFSQLSFAFSFFTLILLRNYTEFVFLFWGGKALILWSVVNKLNPQNTGYKQVVCSLLFDFLFLLYYLTVGLNALFTKHLTWALRKNATSQTKHF